MLLSRSIGLLFCGLFIIYGVLAQEIQLDFWAAEELFTARTFPTLIAIGGALVSFLYALSPQPIQIPKLQQQHSAGLLIVIMLVYGLILEPLGFIPSTSLFLAACITALGERRLIVIIPVALGVAILFYALMTALGIHLEPGLLAIFHA